MTQNQKDEQFIRLVDALLAPVRNYNGDDLAATVTSAFDAIEMLDSMSLKQIDRCYGMLLAAAHNLVTFGQQLIFSIGDPLRDVLINNAVNLVLLVMESFERQGDKEGADKAFEIAFNHVQKLACHGESFPQERRILTDLIRNGRGMKSRLADLQKARRSLVKLHRERRELSEKVARQLSSAQFILREADNLRDSAMHLFELDFGDNVVRLRDQTPHSLERAAQAILYGRGLIREIEAMPPSAGVLERAKRAVTVSLLVCAHVQASLACAYVEYFKGAKALDVYGVLAHQALAYAEATQGNNWTFYAPLVHIRPEEALFAKSERDLLRLVNYGEAALAYALCLKAQVQVAPAKLRPPVGQIKDMKKPEPKALDPMVWPECRAFNENHQGVTQEEIVSSHFLATGEDLRELHWLGCGRRTECYPKARLVGFERSRGGKGHRKAKKVG